MGHKNLTPVLQRALAHYVRLRAEHGGPVTRATLAEACGVGMGTLQTYASGLRRAGHVIEFLDGGRPEATVRAPVSEKLGSDASDRALDAAVELAAGDEEDGDPSAPAEAPPAAAGLAPWFTAGRALLQELAVRLRRGVDAVLAPVAPPAPARARAARGRARRSPAPAPARRGGSSAPTEGEDEEGDGADPPPPPPLAPASSSADGAIPIPEDPAVARVARRRERDRARNRARNTRKHDVRPRTIGMRELRKKLPVLSAAAPASTDRPKTRGDCAGGARPCPWVSCKWHLYLDVNASGTIRINFPDLDVDELVETCALDVADRGGVTLEEVGAYSNVTRERVRQLEELSTTQIRNENPRLSELLESDDDTRRRDGVG